MTDSGEEQSQEPGGRGRGLSVVEEFTGCLSLGRGHKTQTQNRAGWARTQKPPLRVNGLTVMTRPGP